MNQRVNNYQLQADKAREAFLRYNQEEMIRRFGLNHDDGFIYIRFFGVEHKIDRTTGDVFRGDNGEPAGFEAAMTIYDMLCGAKPEVKLSGKWQTLANLSPHSNFGAPGKNMFGRQARRFSGKTLELKRICEELGGIPATTADAGYRFEVFPFLPIIFQYWEGDDEFEPKINFLFDAGTLDYIHFETAWYPAGYLLAMIENKQD